MSVEDAAAFVQQLSSSVELQREVTVRARAAIVAEMARLGAERGYSFSPEDYQAAVEQHVAEARRRHADGELDDDQLARVTGGVAVGVVVQATPGIYGWSAEA